MGDSGSSKLRNAAVLAVGRDTHTSVSPASCRGAEGRWAAVGQETLAVATGTPAVQPVAGLAPVWGALGWGSQWARRPVRGSAARSHMGAPLEDTYQVTRTGLPPLMLSLPSDVCVLRW